jgi:hypothetical protein
MREGASPDEAELGYRLRKSAWGKGYATEGSRALIRKGFTEMGVQRVVAETMAVHLASRRVMEKAGLTLVRTFHQPWPYPIEGDELGDVEYALTKAEWEQQDQAGRDRRSGPDPLTRSLCLVSGLAGVQPAHGDQAQPEVADLGQQPVERRLVSEQAADDRLLAPAADVQAVEPGGPPAVQDARHADLIPGRPAGGAHSTSKQRWCRSASRACPRACTVVGCIIEGLLGR